MSCKCHQFEPEQRLEGYYADFSTDAQMAMEASPAYFVKWYTAKSIALVGVACALAYYVGKSSRRPSMGRYKRRR